MKNNLPFKKSDHFSLFLIPEDHSEVRRLRLSVVQLRFLFAFVLVGVVFSFFNLAGFLYYRSLYNDNEAERQENKAAAQERDRVLEGLKGLEETVHAAERYADRLAGLVGVERLELRKGLGPVKKSAFDPEAETQALKWDEVGERMERTHHQAASIDLRLQELVRIQEDKLLYHASRPSIWPVKGWVTSEFGFRRSPLSGRREFHGGLDIAAQWGSNVEAPSAGMVRFSGDRGGMGRTIVIDHGYGIESYYGHTSQIFVKQGQVVERGMRIARVGTSGRSTGPHLHYEIHVDGIPIDPMQYILQ
ncbi:MAG: M23 family metallopeptidase [Deltaproteobacteria bacterium]|nr:M23 family metallopeptidase [Deltaproteobacteria bacterium]MBI4374775.1 M23 family metallopeptidase [Deltaproteobacteria bacterium]